MPCPGDAATAAPGAASAAVVSDADGAARVQGRLATLCRCGAMLLPAEAGKIWMQQASHAWPCRTSH